MCQFFENDKAAFDTIDSLIVSEGKYWRRNSDTISNEYKKWRSFAVKNKKFRKINSYKDLNEKIKETAAQDFSQDLNQHYNFLYDIDPSNF